MKILFSQIMVIFLSFTLFLFNVNAEEVNFNIVKFYECIDGDTAEFLLNNKKIKVRFLAIDTPETVHPKKKKDPIGLLASDYTCKRIKEATIIKLEYDKSSSKTDKYNRFLAWIWLDDNLLQKELIAQGYGKVAYIYGKYNYIDDLYSLEDIAKENKLGIWNTNNYVYKVEFYIDNEIITQEVFENDKIKYFEPYKEGYTFIKWNYNNESFDFNTRINEDIKLEAVFEKDVTLMQTIIFIILFSIYFANKKIIKKKLKK